MKVCEICGEPVYGTTELMDGYELTIYNCSDEPDYTLNTPSSEQYCCNHKSYTYVEVLNFTKGQEVWSSEFGTGIVVNIDKDDEYPVEVKFLRNLFETYDFDGFRTVFSKYKTLYTEPQK